MIEGVMPVAARLIPLDEQQDRVLRDLALEARSMQEIVEAIRVWREMRGVSLETLDHIAGWPEGYSNKLLAPEPFRNLGWQSLGLGLSALAIKLVVVEDPVQRKLVEKRWLQRERPRNDVPAARKQK